MKWDIKPLNWSKHLLGKVETEVTNVCVSHTYSCMGAHKWWGSTRLDKGQQLMYNHKNAETCFHQEGEQTHPLATSVYAKGAPINPIIGWVG